LAIAVQFVELLRAFARHDCEFMVVGAMAGVAAGVPVVTNDLDLLYRKNERNHEAMMKALQDVEARYLDPAGRDLRPTMERLENQRLHLLTTRLGRLDLLATIGSDWTYEGLLPKSRTVPIGDVEPRILSLDLVIEAKRIAGRPKDIAALPVFEETLRLRQARGEELE
jgi:hypothetical protein